MNAVAFFQPLSAFAVHDGEHPLLWPDQNDEQSFNRAEWIHQVEISAVQRELAKARANCARITAAFEEERQRSASLELKLARTSRPA